MKCLEGLVDIGLDFGGDWECSGENIVHYFGLRSVLSGANGRPISTGIKPISTGIKPISTGIKPISTGI